MTRLPAAALLLAHVLASAVQSQSLFSYTSDPGDYIGQGGSAVYTDSDGTWTALRNFDNGVSLSFDDGGSHWWSMEFAAPNSVELSPGTYTNAERFPFQATSSPGLSITGEGRGCNTLTGSFVVTQALFDWFGNPVRFNASSIEQHCEGSTPALHATVGYAFGVLGTTSFSSGNILLTYQNRVYEYTTGGSEVKVVPIMESDGTPSTEEARDLVLDRYGTLHVFNGTSDPLLSSFGSFAGNWRHDVHDAEWNVAFTVYDGAVTSYGRYVFAADGTFDATGIVRFDTFNDYLSQRFADGTTYVDLNVGLDGTLYALQGDQVTVDVYHPETMAAGSSITLGSEVRALAVNAAGDIFGAAWTGIVYHFDPGGVVQKSLATVSNLIDIDVSSDGDLVCGSWLDGVVVTTEALASFSSIQVDSGGNDPIFVAWVGVVQQPPFFADGFETGTLENWNSSFP